MTLKFKKWIAKEVNEWTVLGLYSMFVEDNNIFRLALHFQCVMFDVVNIFINKSGLLIVFYYCFYLNNI